MNTGSAVADLSMRHRGDTSDAHKAAWGQFFTPPEIAAFMAGMAEVAPGRPLRILDPGAGAGILGITLAQRSLARGASAVTLVAIEAEPGARALLTQGLAAVAGGVQTEVRSDDFLSYAVSPHGRAPLSAFDVAIANPPYFKMSPSDPRGGDAPNAYARFMEVAAQLLRPGGQLIFIVPRSFASGLYFKTFRRRFHATMCLERVHVFDSRRDAFRGDKVLQESIIVVYRKGATPSATVTLSTSVGTADLGSSRLLMVDRAEVMRPDDHGVLYLPLRDADLATMRIVHAWPQRLSDLGLAISTGPVVPFRTDALRAAAAEDTVPMLWMQHIRPGSVRWPLGAGSRKAEHIGRVAGDKLLVANHTYIVMRRFSAKEEPRRLTVAVLRGGALPGDRLGLENHLNFIHRPGGALDEGLAYGLGGLLGSTLVDDYFRIQSGNTQVSATEVRALPLPDASVLRRLGARLMSEAAPLSDQARLDRLVSTCVLSPDAR